MQKRRGAPGYWSGRKGEWLHPLPYLQRRRGLEGQGSGGWGCQGKEGLLASWSQHLAGALRPPDPLDRIFLNSSTQLTTAGRRQDLSGGENLMEKAVIKHLLLTRQNPMT